MRYEQTAGMTLIEMLVAITVFSALLLLTASSVAELYRQNSYAIEQTREVDSARRGVTAWTRDAKEMTIGEDGTYPVAIAEEHRFGYYSDTDRDKEVEYVEYQLDGTTLYKYTYQATGTPATYDTSSPDQTDILSRYVQNIDQATSTFRYYDNMGTLLTTPVSLIDVRYLRMQLIVNIDPRKNPGEFLLQSSVAPRNLKDNL